MIAVNQHLDTELAEALNGFTSEGGEETALYNVVPTAEPVEEAVDHLLPGSGMPPLQQQVSGDAPSEALVVKPDLQQEPELQPELELQPEPEQEPEPEPQPVLTFPYPGAKALTFVNDAAKEQQITVHLAREFAKGV